MKKLHAAVLALSVATLGIPAIALGVPQGMSQDEAKPELVNIKGTVRADGNKITFVADDTWKAWDVINP